MEIKSEFEASTGLLTLTLVGKFDYTCHQSFLSSYETIGSTPKQVIIDLLEVPCLDSSALGMLLLLRTHAGGDNSDVHIINSQPDITKLLKSCKFDELFRVSAL